MLCAEAAAALAPRAGDLKAESSSASLSFPWEPGQTRTGLVFHSVSFGIQPSLAHFHRLVVAACEPLPQAFLLGFVLKVPVRLVVEFLTIIDKVHNSLLI